MTLTKARLAILSAILLLAFAGRSVQAAECGLRWTDLSGSIPTAVLDQTFTYPLLSFAAGRGTDWLVGSPNQLFLVTGQGKTFDLTPDLNKFGFQKIRQVASDGQSWLVVGDSSPWFTQPDLAFRYDGMYWKNVSPIMAAMPPQEWIGPITGKRGLWLIPTDRSLFVWQSSLKQIVGIPLPNALLQNRHQQLKLYPVTNGWLLEATINSEKLYYMFDGQNFQNLKGRLGDLNRSTQVGSDGGRVLLMTAASDVRNPKVHGVYFDGKTTRQLDVYFKTFVDNKNKLIGFFPEADLVWDGKHWLLSDDNHHLACFDGRHPASKLPDMRDSFVASAYGTDGRSLHVGYSRDAKGKLVPRLVMTSE